MARLSEATEKLRTLETLHSATHSELAALAEAHTALQAQHDFLKQAHAAMLDDHALAMKVGGV